MRRPLIRSALGALALACALALPAAAQGRWASTTPEQRAEKLTKLMQEKLALTSEQLPKVKAINLDSANKMQALFEGSQSRAEKRQAAQQIQQSKEAALKQVFTPEQFEKYEAAREEMQQHGRERMKEHRRDEAAAGEAAPPAP